MCQFIDEVKHSSRFKGTDVREIITAKLKALDPNESISDKLVLMLTRKSDREADFVGANLIIRGIDYVRLNIEDVPNKFRINYTVNPNLSIEFTINGRIVDATRIVVVWLRNFEPQVIGVSNDKLSRAFSIEQWNDAYRILQNNLKCKWINPPDSIVKADDRVQQLSAAKNVGFRIPETIITNDPIAAKKFYLSHKGDIIVKALHHHAIEIENKVYSMYTHRVTYRDLPRLKDLAFAPCILQKRITKKSDLRVTVVGKKIFAVEIDSQSVSEGREDLHRIPLENLPKRMVKLGSVANKKCIQLVNSFGLYYAAIDFVRDKDNKLVFLEINPTGDWLWIEQQTGLPITLSVTALIESFAS